MGTLSGVKSEVETRIREQLERVLAGMDLVSRDEFEAVKAMAAKARSEQEDLQVRVARLESRLAALETPASRTTADSLIVETTKRQRNVGLRHCLYIGSLIA